MIYRIAFIICTFCCFNLPALAQTNDNHTQERIINFHSDISIDSTGLVKVTEHLKVYSKGDRILHGIVRIIPLYRTDIFAHHQKANFEITQILKNGQSAPYTTKDIKENRNIYIGTADQKVKPGIIDYVISYQNHGQIGFFDGYDELYWNVTGNDWNFDIEQASATINFPKGALPGNTSCYTGFRGSKSSNCNISVNKTVNPSVTFSTKNMLKSGQGFTIAAAFTPNLIKRPGILERIYSDYLDIVLSVILVLLFASAYYLTWKKYGKDPVKPVVIPTFQIPNGWSPAMIRYFHKKTYDDKAVAATMINIAVKKLVKISDEDNNTYKFNKLKGDQSKLAAEELILYNTLFKSKTSIDTIPGNGNTFDKARELFEKKIKAQLKLSDYYSKNTKPAIWTGVVTITVLAIYMALQGVRESFSLIFMIPFFLIGLYLFIQSIKYFRTAIGTAILLLPLSLLFAGLPLLFGVHYIRLLPIVSTISVLMITVLYVVFLSLIKAYSQQGIVIKNDIEGFKLYLETAEEQRLNLLNPPEHTQEVFERFLPYAIALDLENAWGSKFHNILSGTDEQPEWYAGRKTPYRDFISNIPRSFYNAVTVSGPATRSSGSSSRSSSGSSSGSSTWSSGSSGGGSSGGGGGGGGGSGW